MQQTRQAEMKGEKTTVPFKDSTEQSLTGTVWIMPDGRRQRTGT